MNLAAKQNILSKSDIKLKMQINISYETEMH